MALKKCRECKTEVSTEAKTCPKCGVKSPTRTVSPLVAFMGLFVLFVVCVAGTSDKKSTSTPGTANAAPAEAPAVPPPPTLEITNVQLWRDYDGNEVAADEKYKGRTLLVSGSVDSIDKDAFNNIVVRLRSPNQFMSTMVDLEDSEKAAAAALRKGAAVKVLCKGVSKLIGAPHLKDCRLR